MNFKKYFNLLKGCLMRVINKFIDLKVAHLKEIICSNKCMKRFYNLKILITFSFKKILFTLVFRIILILLNKLKFMKMEIT